LTGEFAQTVVNIIRHMVVEYRRKFDHVPDSHRFALIQQHRLGPMFLQILYGLYRAPEGVHEAYRD
jgi:hypothetical protein